MTKQLRIDVRVINPIGDTCIAVAQLGGFTIRGGNRANPVEAVRALLTKIADGQDDNMLALQFALAGTTLDDTLALPAGETE